jgi:hypothetical protein
VLEVRVVATSVRVVVEREPHQDASRWEFSQADAERLIGEFRAAEVSASAGGVRQKSDSAVQRRAEDVIRGLLAESLGRCLQARTIKLKSGASVQVDAVAGDCSVLAEIFARQGTLKPGQQKKVAIDALKLITIGHAFPEGKLMLVFADEAAGAYARGGGWLAHALRSWNVQIKVVDIPPGLRADIRAAQATQRMVNADDVADDITVEPAP